MGKIFGRPLNLKDYKGNYDNLIRVNKRNSRNNNNHIVRVSHHNIRDRKGRQIKKGVLSFSKYFREAFGMRDNVELFYSEEQGALIVKFHEKPSAFTFKITQSTKKRDVISSVVVSKIEPGFMKNQY